MTLPITYAPARVRFRVYGLPVTQGSVRALLPRGASRPVVVHDNSPQFRGWRNDVRTAALEARPGRIFEGAVVVQLAFHLPIPKSRPTDPDIFSWTEKQRREWLWPWRKPDLDRLCRAVFDALTGVLLSDDAQVVDLHAVKDYAADPGVEVEAWEMRAVRG